MEVGPTRHEAMFALLMQYLLLWPENMIVMIMHTLYMLYTLPFDLT